MKIKFVLFLIMFGAFVINAETDCVPKNVLNDKAILEEECSKEFNSKCSCNIGKDVTCGFKPNEELLITLGNPTTIEFMKFKTGMDVNIDNVFVIEIMCTELVGYKCSCKKNGNEVRCMSDWAEFYVHEVGDGIRLQLSEFNAHIPYCEELVAEVGDTSPSGSSSSGSSSSNTQTTPPQNNTEEEEYITNIEINEEEEYEIKIANKRNTIEVIAISFNFNEDSNILPDEINENDIQNIMDALKEKYDENYEIEIIESIKIDLENIKDGEDIHSASITFRIPKSKLKGDIVVVRIDDNGVPNIIIPEIIEAGEDYIILVKTDGLSLYAVATINQITPSPIQIPTIPTNEKGNEEIANISKDVCGSVAGLILLLLSFYYVKSKN